MISDITQFTEAYDEKESYDYSMFVYGNYTYRDNLEADSLVVVMRNVIPYLSERYKIHFTVVVPQLIKSFDFPNVEQIVYPLPTYCNTMRTHFDASKMLEMIDWRRKDFDIFYSHVPEHTAQIANVLFNNTHFRPKIIGYSHWFEVAENAPYEKTMLPAALIGVLDADEFGVNSMWLKQRVLQEAQKYFTTEIIERLDKIIQPHYLGVDQVRARSTQIEPKSVIFNHRSSAYTGWDWFCSVMDEVWETRQDFMVYTTLTKIDRPWNTQISAPTRTEYMDRLHQMQFGVGCFQQYSAWSISVTDGLSVSVPYLLPSKLCYPEMVGADYPYLYDSREDFIQQFNQMLDTPPTIDTETLVKSMRWKDRISTWFGGWDSVFELKGMRKETDTLREILALIKKNGYQSKKQIFDTLKWGVQIKWSAYRNSLRTHPNVRLLKHGYEWKD